MKFDEKGPSETERYLNNNPTFSHRKYFFLLLTFLSVITFIVVILTVVFSFIQPPKTFIVNERITIEAGKDAATIASDFKEIGLIKSEFVFYTILVTLFDPTNIKASSYKFNKPLDAYELAKRISKGDFNTDLIKFVHYEGERAIQIAKRADELLTDFDEVKFVTLAMPLEGKLFPDTYLIPRDFSAEELVVLLNETFETRIKPLRPAIENSDFTEYEILTIASIIEREANSKNSMRMVAGIINNRIEEGMPLQLDASIEYVLGKPLSELTAEDLKQNSPYNTYINLGLPPTPIGNPGITAIEAVLEPEENNYLFYLTGRDGNFYYATNFAQHQFNINNYLR